jgi:hypothetical protein
MKSFKLRSFNKLAVEPTATKWKVKRKRGKLLRKRWREERGVGRTVLIRMMGKTKKTRKKQAPPLGSKTQWVKKKIATAEKKQKELEVELDNARKDLARQEEEFNDKMLLIRTERKEDLYRVEAKCYSRAAREKQQTDNQRQLKEQYVQRLGNCLEGQKQREMEGRARDKKVQGEMQALSNELADEQRRGAALQKELDSSGLQFAGSQRDLKKAQVLLFSPPPTPTPLHSSFPPPTPLHLPPPPPSFIDRMNWSMHASSGRRREIS